MAAEIVERTPTSPKFMDLTGQKFGQLTVLSFVGFQGRLAKWNVRCDCGEVDCAFGNQMRAGRKTRCASCGSQVTHGLSRNGLYNTWQKMVRRCTDHNDPAYPDYGGRGINVCERWLNDVKAFVMDVGERPTPNHSLGRIDNDGDYCPENCRWETQQQQMRNTRHNRKITSSSGETLLACEWCERLGISHQRLYQRMDVMPEAVAVSYPAHGTSPEHKAWKAEMKLKHSEWKWRDRHLQKLAREFERLLRGESPSDPLRISHAERRERRMKMAKMIRKGASPSSVAEQFGVGLPTVINALQEFPD